jgi:quinol monooxygenase YgiN
VRFSGPEAFCRHEAAAEPASASQTITLEYNPASMAKPRTKKTSLRGKPARRRSTGSTAKLPKSAVTLVVILRAKEGQEGLLEAELRALIAPTRREEGCLTYDLHRALDTPGAFLLHEVWMTRDHHRRHTKTPHFLRWDARKDALLAVREATFWSHIA